MKRIFPRWKRKVHRGFTLTEVMAVLAIMAVLMMIVIPGISQYSQFAENQRRSANMSILVAAVQRWSADDENTAVRPRDFNSKNTQGKRMYTYVKDAKLLQEIGTINPATGMITVHPDSAFSYKEGILSVKKSDCPDPLVTFDGGPVLKKVDSGQ